MEHPDKGPREETMREKFGTMGVIQSLDANEPLVRGPCAVWVERDEESNIIDWGGTMTPQEVWAILDIVGTYWITFEDGQSGEIKVLHTELGTIDGQLVNKHIQFGGRSPLA